MKLGTFIAVIALVGVVAILGATVQTDMAEKYGKTTEDLSYLNRSSDIQDQLNSTATDLLNPVNVLASLAEGFYGMVVGALTGVQKSWAYAGIAQELAADIAPLLGIPEPIMILIDMLIHLTILVGIIYVFTKVNLWRGT